MLRIRAEQMDHFADKTRERFVTLMTDYIRESFPSSKPAQDGPTLRAWVGRALSVCERYQVTLEPQAAQLILLLLELGLDAPELRPWVHDALAKNVAPIGKVRRLVDACREQGITALEDLIVYEDLFRDAVMEV